MNRYHQPTVAERQTSLARCCIAGCRAPRRSRVLVVVRPESAAGGYLEYSTPHGVCDAHRESTWLTVDAVARAGEQKIIRAAAEIERGWPASKVLLSVVSRVLTGAEATW